MPRLTRLARTLAVALTASALAASAAVARPIDPTVSHGTVQTQRVQDLRHLMAGPPSKPGTTPVRKADVTAAELSGRLSGERTADVTAAELAGAAQPRPVASSPAPAIDSGDNIPWVLVALGIAGGCLVVGAMTARTLRARVAT